ncbi:hypothetical protein [Brevibacillus fulvus]|uniref:Uncharacterized protein n=1 Tax=Brevibacillus fulvus TaxID=1125967 RepID=A0A938XZW1_9BACL|nr:hypothetical protein [Brevibacillus fulvus]MBM7588972.1 hypothetical protein [Brevibacillus fulvus]
MYTFAFIALAVNFLIIVLMPKRLTRKEMYMTGMTMLGITLFIDCIVGFALDLFDDVDKEIHVVDIILEATIGPSYGLIITNFLPKGKAKFWLYLVAVVIISLVLESLFVYFKFLVYKGWTLWYSSLVYVLGMLFLRWHLRFIRSPE